LISEVIKDKRGATELES